MVSDFPLQSLLLTLFLSAHFPTSYAQLEDTTQPEVTIPQGTLLGIHLTTRNNRTISGFMGIPYGQPPTGNLRFANPVAADGWTGTLNASVDGNACVQAFGTSVSGDEDCLNINVYTPQLPQNANSSLLPVMVYIYGGGFGSGSAAYSDFGPGYLLDADVVLAIPNYRVGVLGFLSTGDEFASGNWGLKDQVLALKWVQDNIQYFGGDPDQVTFFGESAGAGAVHLLTLSDTTIGLFHRYITQSGSALGIWAHRPSAAYASRAFELGEYLGCSNDTSEALITCLRSVDAGNITNSKSVFTVWNNLPDIVWGPTDEPDIEGAVLTDSPKNLFAAGAVRDLPWISGVVRDEGLAQINSFYMDEDLVYDFMDNIDTLLPVLLGWTYESESTQAAWLEATKAYYFGNYLTANTSELLTNLTMVFGDCHFYYPTHKGVEKQYGIANSPQYYYLFNYVEENASPTSNGITHGKDLFYLFPRSSTFTERDYLVLDAIIQLWTSFATNGTPTSSVLNGATWEPYSTVDGYLRMGNDTDPTIEMEYSFTQARMEFWASLYDPVDTETVDDVESDDSGTATASPNSIFILLVICSKLVLTGFTADRLL